jgi:hypothetical protein
MTDHRNTPLYEEPFSQREEQERKVAQEPLEEDDRLERERWFFASRADADGKVPLGLLGKASPQRRRVEWKRKGEPPTPPGGPASVNWTPIGPSVVAHGQASGHPAVSGRINAIAVGPGGSRVYIGAANGGVWFSSNGGANWNPLDDYSTDPSFVSGLEEDSLSVGALAVRFGATAANDTIFVGTGEPGAGGSDAYFGIGILYSPVGGAPGTWSLEGTNLAGLAIYRIVIDPDVPTQVYAATSRGLYRRPTSGSFTNWTHISSPPFTNVNGSATDLIVVGSGASKHYYAAFNSDRVYSSPDGVNWTAISGMNTAGRTVLAAGESDTSVVYALDKDGNLYRLVSGSFQQVSGVPKALFFHHQGWYDIVLAVDPANANTIYMAGDLTLDEDWSLSFYRGTITGKPGSYNFPFNSANDIFTNAYGQPDSSSVPFDPHWIGQGIHPDAHSFAFATNPDGTHDGSNVWIGTDGGIFQSTMSGARSSFVAHNTGLAITEMSFMAQRPDTDAVVFSGCQDNGTLRGWGEEAWFETPEGDGGGVAIDPNNQYRVMCQYTNASLYTCTDGGASADWHNLSREQKFPPITGNTMAQKNAASSENKRTNFYAPIAVSPAGVLPTLAAFGTYRLWLTSDWGTTWVTLPSNTNPYSSTVPNQTQDQLDGSSIVAIAFASGTRIFAATSNQVWRFDFTGGLWTMAPITTTGLHSNHFITALAVENPTTGSFYVTLGRSGPDHVWYFDGTNWQSAGLSITTIDAPTHAAVVDPANSHHLYIGTDVGCWKGIKTATNTWTWTLFSSGLPEAAITDIGIHARTRLLRVATHGRGIWEIPLDATSAADPDVYMRVNYADTGRVSGGARFPWVDGAQDPTAIGYNVYHWMSADIKVRRGSFSGLPALNTPPDYLDFATNIGDYIDSTTRIETADVLGTDRIFVEVHNRGLTPVPGSQVRVLLLLTSASAGLPALPANYASHINAGDTSTSWLAGTPWSFADPTAPYRTLPGILDVRTPQLVEYDVDLSTLALPAGPNHVCVAAFVTTTLPSERLTSTNTNLDQVTMQDKHIVHRNLHLIAAGARPAPNGGSPNYAHMPQTFVIDFHNATDVDTHVDLVFQRPNFPGSFSLLLPMLTLTGAGAVVLKGWKMVEHNELETSVRSHLGHWLEQVGELVAHLGEALEQKAAIREQEVILSDIRDVKVRKLSNLDRSRIYQADDSPTLTVDEVAIPAGGYITAAVTVQAPADAQPGNRFRFDVMQKRDGEIVGGSTYVFVVIPESSDDEM